MVRVSGRPKQCARVPNENTFVVESYPLPLPTHVGPLRKLSSVAAIQAAVKRDHTLIVADSVLKVGGEVLFLGPGFQVICAGGEGLAGVMGLLEPIERHAFDVVILVLMGNDFASFRTVMSQKWWGLHRASYRGMAAEARPQWTAGGVWGWMGALPYHGSRR